MQKNNLFIASLLFCSAGVLVSCGSETTSSSAPYDVMPESFDHYFSNQVRFSDMGIVSSYSELQKKTFMQDKVAKLNLKSYTDGDTAVFYLNGGEEDSYTNPLKYSYDYITVRYLAIDTPESTSSIEGWGKAASNYGKELLVNAEGIIVDATSIDTSDCENVVDSYRGGVRLDSNATRWLGLVWYCPDGGNPEDLTQYRSYQLDILEECYSFYTGDADLLGSQYVYFADEQKEPKLFADYKSTFGSLTLGDVMTVASQRMERYQQRYTGYQQDPNYDYSRKPTDYTITQAVEQFEELSSKAKFVRLKGVITSFIGTNFYFQDAQGTPLYVYMGISGNSINRFFHVGDTIMISGRLAEYGGQMQLSGIDWNSDDTFGKVEGEEEIAMPQPLSLTADDLDKNKLDTYIGKLVKIDLTVRSLGRSSKDNSFTAYCTDVIKNLGGSYNTMSIRINGTLAPGYEREDIEALKNKKVTVTAVLGIYSEMDYTKTDENYPSYQLVPGNRMIAEDGTIVSDIVEVTNA